MQWSRITIGSKMLYSIKLNKKYNVTLINIAENIRIYKMENYGLKCLKNTKRIKTFETGHQGYNITIMTTTAIS